MSLTKVVSFDAEGTLVTPRFSQVIWHESIPELFAKRWGMDLARAKKEVLAAYEEVGDQKMEWYDIKYWFKRFDLSDHEELLSRYRHEISYYDDVMQILPRLAEKHDLIVISNSTREFLDPLLEEIQGHFVNIYSALSDFCTLKSPELYSKICDMLSLRPGEMVHVGDSWEFDYEMSVRAGVKGLFLDREGVRRGDRVIGDLWQLLGKV